MEIEVVQKGCVVRDIEPEEYKKKNIKLSFRNLSKLKERKEEFAEIFCEGSSELKKLLIFLWEHDIETIGCCIGHHDQIIAYPYIGFIVPEKLDFAELMRRIQWRCTTFHIEAKHLHQDFSNEDVVSIHPIFRVSDREREEFFAAIRRSFREVI